MCDFLAETAKNQGTELATKCCDTPLCNVNPISQKLDTRNISMISFAYRVAFIQKQAHCFYLMVLTHAVIVASI